MPYNSVLRLIGPCVIGIIAFGLASCSSAHKSVLSIIPTTDNSQFGTVIEGRVVDRENGPIIGAMVNLGKPGSGEVVSACTDTEGKFRMATKVVGDFPLTVTCLGYETAKVKKLSISSGQRISVDCKLGPASGIPGSLACCPPPMVDPRDTSSGARVTERNGQIQIHYY